MRVGHGDRANPSTARRTETGLRWTTTSCREHRPDPASPSAHSAGRRTKIVVAEHRPAREGWHRATPFFRPKKSVGAALNFVSAIQAATIFQPMNIVAHHSGVVCPALGRHRYIVVTVKEADPIPGFIHSRQTD